MSLFIRVLFKQHPIIIEYGTILFKALNDVGDKRLKNREGENWLAEEFDYVFPETNWLTNLPIY